MIKKLITIWRLRNSPMYEYWDQYETLIRLARRCAYDLDHVTQSLPKDSYFIKEFDMREQARWWVQLFAKGNPGKDYRTEQAHTISRLEMKIRSLERELGREEDQFWNIDE